MVLKRGIYTFYGIFNNGHVSLQRTREETAVTVLKSSMIDRTDGCTKNEKKTGNLNMHVNFALLCKSAHYLNFIPYSI